MRGAVIICGLVLTAAIAVTAYAGVQQREQRVAPPAAAQR